MDPVSRVLGERERRQPTLVPYVAAAVVLHAAIAAGVIAAVKTDTARPAQLPVVSVRLIRPQAPAPRPSTHEPARRPARQEPEPPPPAPEPEAKASPAPAPPVAEPEQPASNDAMPAARSSVTPAPRPEPASSGPPGPSTRGLSVQEGSGPAGIPADFQFTYYIDRMLALIESNWYKPPLTAECRARVRFTIGTSGRVDAITLEESSGIPSFDRAALRALYATNPLPPLPPAYRKSTLTVHLTFSE